ncbi:Ankyrin-1 [Symbiodinium microadriaticum]|uniref:Ankyrin-1 n=1 Tax=Symbiodinium microadriaticum TaxID=2951 RepID=A0A1Q9CES5_SYMMI|nr:Ankyrin-1 [Symbiodinium microadriaticum]CAE7803953.1 ANK1 [Symbiodinium microadriaticum]CAE7945153.1 ANK1 [Symbiodinium sp. KB8]
MRDAESLSGLYERVIRAAATFLEAGTAVRTYVGSKKVHVAALWANVNRPEDLNVPHQHAADGAHGESVPLISAVYFPNQGAVSGCIARLQFPGHACTPNSSKECSIDPRPGTLVLFPASSLHSVEACDAELSQSASQPEAIRVSFAFNLLARELSDDLYAHAASGDLSSMESQLQKANIASQDGLGFTVLHHAAESGHLSMVDLLLERRASPLVLSNNGSLPLHLALASEATSVAYRLLESAPASASQAGGAGGSMAIHSAAGQGDVALLGHLLEMRAGLQSKQADGSTPLHLAVQNGHTEVVAFILQQGRERHGGLVTARDERGLQPAHEAARGGLLPILSELLSARAEPNAKDDEGHSLLYWATYGGHRGVLEGLLQARAEIEIPEPAAESSKRGEAMANYLAAALVGSGSDPQIQTSELSLMHVAAAAGHISMAEALQGMEMSPTAAASSSKLQPLHLAAAGGHVAMLGWLLLARGQVDARARGDLCPIHLASLDGHLQALEALLSFRASPNAVATDGSRPLHVAASRGHQEAARLLLHARAVVGAASRNKETAVDRATKAGHISVAAFLGEAESMKQTKLDEL